jgi:hypothetical protein
MLIEKRKAPMPVRPSILTSHPKFGTIVSRECGATKEFEVFADADGKWLSRSRGAALATITAVLTLILLLVY